MPHQCTNCGETFPDGSKEMLSGCPECGGNKFQFRPASSLSDDASSTRRSDDASPTRRSASESDADAPDAAARTDADASAGAPGSTEADAEPESHSSDDVDAARSDAETGSAGPDAVAPDSSAGPSADSEADRPAAGDENTAQASARRDVVDPDELASSVEREARERPPQDADGQVVESQSDDDQPGLDELREELNEQFESIKIVNPGQYELNLMELYDRDEYIISLQEDGRYVIDVPDTWQDDTADDA